MKAVLSALRECEVSNPTAGQIALMRKALITWKSADPKEFSNRTNNGQVVERLFKELGLNPNQIEAVPELNAYVISLGASRANVGQRPAANFVRQAGSVVDYMRGLDDNGQRAAVLLIDTQSTGGKLDVKETTPTGFTTRYNHLTVAENQAEVLQFACAYGFPVINITTGNEPTLDLLSREFPTVGNGLIEYCKLSNNACEGTDLKGSHKSLDQVLQTEAWEAENRLVVMGFDANQCIKGTIFGSLPSSGRPYVKGLLDLGYTMITSRSILASSNRPLEGDTWGPMSGLV
jgi:hypothetical protein